LLGSGSLAGLGIGLDDEDLLMDDFAGFQGSIISSFPFPSYIANYWWGVDHSTGMNGLLEPSLWAEIPFADERISEIGSEGERGDGEVGATFGEAEIAVATLERESFNFLSLVFLSHSISVLPQVTST
jgi:hypothetical protein